MSADDSKKTLSAEEEALFFWWLGRRFYSTTLRGRVMGHSRPMSAAKDYLRFEGLEGLDREASEFLVDVANVGRNGLSMEEFYRKWFLVAQWHPTMTPIQLRQAEHQTDEPPYNGEENQEVLFKEPP